MLPVIAIDTEVVFPPGPETRTLQEKALNGLAAG